MDVKTDLAAELHNWAMVEMKFMQSGQYANKPVPTVEDLSLLCRGQMRDIWQFMIKRVRSSSTVHEIRGNIMLENLSSSRRVPKKNDPAQVELEQLKREKCELQEKLASTLTFREHAQKDSAHMQHKMIQAAVDYQHASKKLDNIQKKTVLLKLSKQQTTEKKEYFAKAYKYLECVARRMADSHEESTDNDVSKASDSGFLESAETVCKREVLHICRCIHLYYEDRICPTTNGIKVEEDSLVCERHEVGELMRQLFTSYGTLDFFTALSTISKAECHKLKTETAKIDIQQDIENLKFQYTKGQLVDIAEPLGIPQTTANALEEGRIGHIQLFLKTLQAQNSAMQIQKQVEEAERELSMHFESLFGNKDALELMRQHIATQLDLAAKSASLECLQKAQTELCVSLEQNLQLTNRLEAQYSQIKSFERLRDTKLELIRGLINQNVSIHGRINMVQSQITKFVQENLLGKEVELSLHIEPLWNRVETEVNLFAETPIEDFQTIAVNSQAKQNVKQLNIYGLSPSNQESILEQIQSTLNFPPYKSTEALMEFVLNAKLQVGWLTCGVKDSQEIREIFCKQTQKSYSISQLEDLADEVTKSDQKQMETTFPLLKKTLSEINNGCNLCTDTKTTVKEWWEQPAQDIKTNVKVNELTFEEWKKQHHTA